MENQTKEKSSIAFIVELFLMFAILLLVIVVITEFFVMTRSESLKAKQLTEAVIVAESTAEVVSRADSGSKAADLVGKMETVENVDVSGEELSFTVKPDGKGNTGAAYDVKVTLESRKNKTGTYVADTIGVSPAGRKEELYTLKTGHYAPKEE